MSLLILLPNRCPGLRALHLPVNGCAGLTQVNAKLGSQWNRAGSPVCCFRRDFEVQKVGDPMKIKMLAVALAAAFSASSLQADESVLVLGKGVYGALCTNCHGDDGKGGGDVGTLFTATPPDLTKLSERADGKFPFSDAYNIIISGRNVPGHGPLEMPVWGSYFMSDALQDRGMNESDAIFVAAGRALSVTYYLESIQE